MTSLAPDRTRAATSPGLSDADACGCREGRRWEVSRRGILKMLGGTALATATLGDAQLAFGATPGTKPNVLVTVVLAGGIDGLSVVVPLGDPDYAPNRPDIAIPESMAMRVDSMFGLHPALAPLYPLWRSGTFGAVHAVSEASPSRSHFEKMQELERSAPGSSIRTGWMDRMIGLLPGSGPLEAVALGRAELPGQLRGPQPKLAVGQLSDVNLPMDSVTPISLWQQAFTQLHAGERAEVSAPMASALAARDAAAAIPASTATGYPDGSWGTALKDIARIVKADTGLRVASVPYNGWDHHENFGGPTSTGSTFAGRLSGLAQGLAAFAADLGPDFGRVTIMTFTEFGRRVKQNGSGGLDHGHGYPVLLLGGGVNGGTVHGRWPGLAKANLDSNLDLAGTTDVRSVVSEILVSRMGVPAASQVFPAFTPTPVGAVRRA